MIDMFMVIGMVVGKRWGRENKGYFSILIYMSRGYLGKTLTKELHRRK